MKKRNFIYGLLSAVLMTSCYEDFTNDYVYSSIGFAHEKPLRTVIADRKMTISVGAAIGGKREVDMNDWADFSIKPELLENTGLQLLPESHYRLSDEKTFRVSKKSLAVADVEIEFTEDFYNDPNSVNLHYALPFQLEASSLDSILDNKKNSIVAIKYISAYHGVYYVKGAVTEINFYGETIGEPVKYINTDLSKNIVRSVSTVSRNVVCRSGVANLPLDVPSEKVLLTINDDNTVGVSTADGGIEIRNGSGTYEYSYDDVNIVSNMEMNIKYEYSKDGKYYRVEETLIRRQDPYRDLGFEVWN